MKFIPFSKTVKPSNKNVIPAASSQRITSETETTPATPHHQEDDEFGKFQRTFLL